MAAIAIPPQEAQLYRRVLRPMGTLLNVLQARYLTLADTAEGLFWHCYPQGNLGRPLGGIVTYGDVPLLIETIGRERAKRSLFGLRKQPPKIDRHAIRRHPLCPDGYSELLRSLGTKFDEQRAQQVMVIERDDHLIVRYSMPLPVYIRGDARRAASISGFHEDIYRPQQLGQLISTVRSYRGNPYYR